MKLESYVIRQTIIAGYLNIIELINGYGLSSSAPIIPKLCDKDQTPLSHAVTLTEASWIGSLGYIGIVGSVLAACMPNLIGRRLCFIIGGICYVLSYSVMTFANSLAMVYVGRILICTCMIFMAVNNIVYIGEIISPDIRGKVFTSTGVFHALGSLLVYCIGPSLSYKGIGYVAIGMNLLYVSCVFHIPESPVYCVIKGNEEGAKKSLQYLGRTKDIDGELKAMIAKINETSAKNRVWRELFNVKSNRSCLLVTIPLMIFQQSSGIITVIMFATSIFQDAGSSILPHVATMIVGVTLVVGTIVSPIFIERCGRKFLLILSTGGCSLSMAILGTYFYFDKYNDAVIESLRWLPLILLVLALFSYSVGLNVVPNTLTGEMFGPNVRGIGSSFTYIIGYIAGFISVTSFSYIVADLGSHIGFWIFALINFTALLFTISIVPETKGKSLMEINYMMEIIK